MDKQATYSKGKALFCILATVLLVLIADQWLKIYIKTHFVKFESVHVIGDWFRLYFIENNGMAFGFSLGGNAGKIVLTIFRMIASIVIVFYLRSLIREGAKLALISLVSLVLAGALGNIIDSLFYGLLFNASTPHEVAQFLPESGGYAPFMMGQVVDMFYFPVIDTFLPDWIPIIGGDRFEFFKPIFNIADAAISTGVAVIIVFRKSLFAHHESAEDPVTEGEVREETP